MATMTKCGQCAASIPLPADIAVLRMTCTYCGAEAPVPDLERRQQLLAERAAEERRADRHAREMRDREDERHRRAEEQKERKQEAKRERTFWTLHRLWIAGAVLVGPAIVGSQFYDLRGRYLGTTGQDRVDLVRSQRETAGCRTVVPSTVRYSNDETIVGMTTPESDRCVEVLAAGGTGHRQLELRLFDPDGRQVAHFEHGGTDGRVQYCGHATGPYRYEIDPGLNDKGRLTYAVLTCPPPPAAAAPGPTSTRRRH
jgi:hypothetical protein